MINPLALTDRRIVVTGASAGIGRATAILLSQLGARVLLVARNRERLNDTLGALDGTGHRIESMDLSQTERLPAWLKEEAAEFGPLGGVVHCAGAQLIRPLRMMTNAEVEGLLSVNLTAALMLAKAFRQREVREPGGGSVVFVSSVMGMVGAAGRSAYCASKGALHSLTKALALECAREGIRVNCVAPGYVKTEMLRQAEATLAEEQLAGIQGQHPLGFGEPRDVAHAIAFLLADTGRWITGSTLVVDGGYTAQ